MKKYTSLMILILLMVFNVFIMPSFFCEQNAMAQIYSNYNNLKVRAYGDSISAGYGLDGYNDYVNKTSLITTESYPNVFMQEYLETFGGEIKSYAVSGDTSSQLVEDILPYINKTAQDYDDFMSTNIFTLCIGANNILSVASANLEKLLKGEMQISEYEPLLQQSVETFQSDYNNYILPAFTQKNDTKVIAMTIYNPYKYVTFNDINVDTQNAQNNLVVKSLLSALDQTFQEVLSTTIKYLEKVNDIIRQSASDNVIVVDIYKLFETFSKEEYKTYVNADLSKMTITKELFESIDWENMNFSNLFSTLMQCSDPHPTKMGQEVIANCHKQNFAVFKLNLETDILEINNDEQEIFFSIIKVGGTSNYVFKLYKNINNNLTLLKETQEYRFCVKAKEIDGKGSMYIEIFENNVKVGQSNQIEYNYQAQDNTQSNQDEEPTQLPQNNNENIFIITLVCVGMVASCLVVFVIIKSVKKSNKM